MALDSGYWEGANENMTTDEVATLLVRLYADYKHYSGCDDNDYATAVGIAIRMLTD
jgi:hypothetical protein